MTAVHVRFRPAARPKSRRAKVNFAVGARSASRSISHVHCGPRRWRCALGRSGRVSLKREGDGGTPRGRWRLLRVFYRPDRIARPMTALPCSALRARDAWCDAPRDRNYNRQVTAPYPASTERMWRDDALYDLVVVMDYNIWPRRRGFGSAIFMHVARAGLGATEGCIALRRRDLLALLAIARPGAVISIP